MIKKPITLGFKDNLSGQFLVAMPSMKDKRFIKSVIYICAHSEEGAMGIVVNKPSSQVRFHELITQLKIIPENEAILLPEDIAKKTIHQGGPVEKKRGFVLHSSDFQITDSTMDVDDQISLTATIDVLKAMAMGKGPQKSLLALGYTGWSSGQLEGEIQDNGWLTAPASHDILFDHNNDKKYERILLGMGINPIFLSSESGNA